MNETDPTAIKAIDVLRSLSQKCKIPVNRKPIPKPNRNIATNSVRHGK